MAAVAVAFDTLRAATRLQEEAGFDETKARVLVSTFAEGMVENLATKDDIAALRREIATLATKDELAALRSEMGTKEELAALRSEMATKEELAAVRSEMATKEELAAVRRATLAAVRREMATKADLRRCAARWPRRQTLRNSQPRKRSPPLPPRWNSRLSAAR